MTNASDRPIRVVIADDHALIRAGVRALLGSFDNTELVGEAADGDEALRVVAETRPDVVIMDIHMPGLDGVSATRPSPQTSPTLPCSSCRCSRTTQVCSPRCVPGPAATW